MGRPALPTKKYRFFSTTSPTTGQTSVDMYNNDGFVGMQVDINVDAITTTGAGVTVTLQGKNESDGTYYTLLADAAHTTAETDRLIVDPRVTTVTANFSVAVPIPRIWRASITTADTTVLTLHLDVQYNN